MKKVKNLIFFVMLLSLFVLVGCSDNTIRETSAQMDVEEYIENDNENGIEEEVEQENEVIRVVLNSGWEERLRKESMINDLTQIMNGSNNGEEQQEQEDDNSREEINSDENNNEDDEEQINEEINYPYYIKINYQANVLNIYTKDENGEYTVPYKAMLCSTGAATPRSGVYSIIYKYRWLEMIGGVYAQYCSQVVGNILIHSVPYSRVYDNSSLQYWSYDKLGQSVSAGCIRLTVGNAKWIYDNCPNGTPVEFYASSDPGPLGKPEEMKISSFTEYRNWDPTDPTEGNPWTNYFEQTSGSIIE
ncbi:MAG: L,D-transpeptidase [Clostridia bacterium]|nr:L,D-transpeptidase [Clostridia bacterium]